MAAHESVNFGQFGDQRDRPDQYGRATRMYQPPGSKNRFELEGNRGSVAARRLGKPDSILPGGRAAKQMAGYLGVWGGGTGSDRPEILSVDVGKGFRGQGLADAMLKLSLEQKPDLSHSQMLSPEGARFAARNPLPNDSPQTKRAQRQHLTADAATTMLGGPKRRGY